MGDTRSELVPDRVTAAAENADFGRPLARADAPRLGGFAAGALVLFLVVVPSGTVVVLSYAFDLPAGIAAPLIVGLMVGLPLAALRQLNQPSQRLQIHVFERGAILHRSSSPDVNVLSWSDVLPYEWVRTFGVGQSATPRDEWLLVIRDARGQDVFTGVGADAVRLVAVIAEVELVRARSVLAAGEAVRYGPFVVADQVLVVDGRARPWSQVGHVELSHDSVNVFGSGSSTRPVERQPRRSTPHQRTLLVLVGERAGGRHPGSGVDPP